MDPLQAHNERVAGRAAGIQQLRDAQMGRTPEPDLSALDFSKPFSEQVPPCANCGQRHYGGRGCPHATGSHSGGEVEMD